MDNNKSCDCVDRGCLVYAISGQASASGELLLTYRYAHQGADLSFEHEVGLDCSPGRRSYLARPRCAARVRILYAPLGAELFACRSCYGLIYRPSDTDDTLVYLAEVGGPAIRELRALPMRTRRRPRRRYMVAPPAALARKLETQPPEGENEMRLWCLRLRAAGLSYRQIAALVGFSKSSVARYAQRVALPSMSRPSRMSACSAPGLARSHRQAMSPAPSMPTCAPCITTPCVSASTTTPYARPRGVW